MESKEKQLNIDNKEQKNLKDNITKPSNSKQKLIFIIVILSIVIICLIGIISFLIISQKIKEKKHKETESSNSGEETIDSKNYNDEIRKQNIINAVYKMEEGKRFSFFNKNSLNLEEGDYIISEKGFSETNLRNLNILEANEGFYLPKKSGDLSVEISFKKNLVSLKDFFKNNNELVKVDLTNFIMRDVKSMESTFSGCSNLYEVDIGGVDSQNLINMDNTFEKCKKLKKINLSMKNLSNSLETNNTFLDCENLEYINLSSFQNVNDKMFEGIKSKPTIQANELISNSIKNIFQIKFNININIIIIENNLTNECIRGSNEKCRDCSSTIKKNCATCNDGYYLPQNSNNKEICLSCSIIEHCIACVEYINNIICLSCETGFILNNNICMKNETTISRCKIGDNELCKSCNEDKDFRNECATCNKGFYLASDAKNKTFCENCNKIEECIECSGTLINPICLKCKEGFKLENNKCLEELCIIGDKDKCKTCRNETGRKKECNSCNEGYYLEENTMSYKCLKCSVKYCKKCSKSFGYEVCNECNNNFLLTKDDNDITYSCICPAYYELTEENICKKTGNWVEAEYYITDIKRLDDLYILKLLNNGLKFNEIEVYMNNTKIPISFVGYHIYYNFAKVGRYKLKINFNTNLYDMSWLFGVSSLTNIKFLHGFDSSKVTNMRDLFSGSNIEYLDLKYLKTNKVEYMDSFIYDCSKLISLDMSTFNTSNLQSMRGIFFNNWNIKEIDFSSFDTSNINRCEYLFDNYPRNITIKISNNFKNCKEFIPLELKVINVDELLCKQIENCKGCMGSKENLSCNICEFGYELRENRCIVPNCTIGENEKCKSCNSQTENECLICNEGYYLPVNSINKKICNKCKVDGCDICDNITGNCQKCQLNYKPILDEITSKIVACKLVCEIGKENKCSLCNLKEENKCLSCNLGYKLMKDGSCKKIENSFIAIYNVTSIWEHVKLFRKEIGNWKDFYLIDFSDIDAYITKIK